MFNEKFKAKSLLGDKPILVIEPNANYHDDEGFFAELWYKKR